MEAAARLGRPEDDLKVSTARAWASRVKAYAPRPRELARPARYVQNVRLIERLRNESLTMLATHRARNLIEFAREVEREGIPGSIVDCGVWNGGSTVLMAIGAPNREIWALDSFEGMPRPGPRDPDARPEWEGMIRGSEASLSDGFDRYIGDTSRLHVVKGWFQDTLPGALDGVDEIAILHVDADWYESVKLVLETLYERVVPGGMVAIDDFKVWQGARDATLEFRRRENVRSPMREGHYWRKP